MRDAEPNPHFQIWRLPDDCVIPALFNAKTCVTSAKWIDKVASPESSFPSAISGEPNRLPRTPIPSG